jgi:hypothetical protein
MGVPSGNFGDVSIFSEPELRLPRSDQAILHVPE